MKKYKRGADVQTRNVTDKKLRGNLKRANKRQRDAAYAAARSEILLQESAGFLEAEGLERTYKFQQEEIREHVDMATKRKMFNLDLDVLGPYTHRYTHNGRHLLIGGRRGHVGAFDWQTGALACELHLQETVRDVQWLHNETMFAVAQRRAVHLYDNTGAELQVLDKHIDPHRLEFLRYHFLLASVGNAGFLKYQDVSTSKLVSEHRTKLGPCKVMRQNPWNAVLHLGHNNGTVTLWSPNMSAPLVKMLCHRGAVQALAIDSSGRAMATSGLDGQLKLWDVRALRDEPIHAYSSPQPPASLDWSQRGLLAVGHGPHVQVWRRPHVTRQTSPYMSCDLHGCGAVREARFAPFEDVLGVGHARGFRSLVVPGAGEPNFDSAEANPYQTGKQRQEAEVKALLDKVPAELIQLDPRAILRVDRASVSTREREKEERIAQDAAADGANGKDAGGEGEGFTPKFKKRGRSSSQRRYLRKQANVIDARREAVRARLEREKNERARAREEAAHGPRPVNVLDRFKQTTED